MRGRAAIVVVVVVIVAAIVFWSQRDSTTDDTGGTSRVTSGDSTTSGALPPLAPLEQLRAAVQIEGAAIRNPWVLAHVLLALGSDATLREAKGSKANSETNVRKLLDAYIDRSTGLTRFPLQLATGDLGEVHPHLVLKVLSEVSPGDPLVAELLQTALATFELPNRFEGWNDTAWFLEAVARNAVPATATVSDGASVATIHERALAELVKAQQRVEALLAEPTFTRPGGATEPEVGGVWSYTCGGQHLLQGLIWSAWRCPGLWTEGVRAQLEQRLQVFLKRLDAEYDYWLRERQRARAAGVPAGEAIRVTSLRLLKLLGHALETLAVARDAGIGLAPELERAAHQTRARLVGVLDELTAKIDLRRLFAAARAHDIIEWRLWIGDACHALHGLRLWE